MPTPRFVRTDYPRYIHSDLTKIGLMFARRAHFVESMMSHAGYSYRDVLARNSHMDFQFRYAASVGATCSLLALTGFASLTEEIMGMAGVEKVTKLISNLVQGFPAPYIIGAFLSRDTERWLLTLSTAPVCTLIGVSESDLWVRKPFAYLYLIRTIRNFLLNNVSIASSPADQDM